MINKIGTFDYVIVGAGTAGCVLANRLSVDPKISVCLLEAGGKDNYIWTHIPVGYLYCMGNPRTDWGYNEGCGYFHVNQRTGLRVSAAKAFLKPVLNRSNLTVLTHAQARKLNYIDGRISGVDIWYKGVESNISANGEVILASGSVGTPQILELSGIGSGRLLT